MTVFAFIQELAQTCIYYFFANSFYNVLKYSDLFYIATQKGKAKILIDPVSLFCYRYCIRLLRNYCMLCLSHNSVCPFDQDWICMKVLLFYQQTY